MTIYVSIGENQCVNYNLRSMCLHLLTDDTWDSFRENVTLL